MAENIRSQLADFQSLRQRIEAVEAEAQSNDRAVRVRVSSSGVVLDITLAQSTARMTREQLARLITETAQAAAYRASDLVHQHIQGVTAAQQQLHQALQAADPRTASAIGGSLTAPEVASPHHPNAHHGVPIAQTTEWRRHESQAPQRNPTPTTVQRQQCGPSEADEDAHFDRFNLDPLGRRGYNNQ
ncbi:YbaB/EbfC family nucleoid-associated protein [Mycobacteroides franklinii]|uniref:YbaB/EbfC family nucleoid-associated protein n=1 Tax=Mycobacteroides franklinii TaxID=948102 RepID=UPI0012FF77DC|nr:YbaB/EbfC family nucleoid-associated protein [Mycobacteroides franklinii]